MSSTPRSKRTVLREALIASALSVRNALRWTPGWLIASVAVQLLIALNPAIQVQLVAWLVNTVEHGERAEIWLPLILLSAFAGTFTILNAVVSALEQRQSLRLNREYLALRGHDPANPVCNAKFFIFSDS